MPKRKRGTDETVEGKLTRGRIDLFRVLKEAKGFERQRLSKRLGDVKSTPQKRQRLEREVEILKSLDLQQTAYAHLVSSLLKVKGVVESPGLPERLKASIPKPDISEEEQIALHNVTSALYNRQQVRDVVEQTVSEVCASLNVDPTSKKGKAKKQDRLGPGKEGKEEQPADRHRRNSAASEDGDSYGDIDEDLALGESSDGKAAEEAISKFQSMLGSSSEDEDSESEFGDDSSGEDSPPKTKGGTKAARPSDSTFLPSLMGGYISGSESASDIDIAPPRKNRRGQRARQAIWEKKYKETAKHLTETKPKDARDFGWDAQRGAVEQGDSRPWKKGIKNPLQNAQQRKDMARDAQPPRRNAPEKPTETVAPHPSWVAAQKAKEKQQKATYQGKKVVFD